MVIRPIIPIAKDLLTFNLINPYINPAMSDTIANVLKASPLISDFLSFKNADTSTPCWVYLASTGAEKSNNEGPMSATINASPPHIAYA